MREFIEELENNQKINLEKGLENKVDISYVLERLKEFQDTDMSDLEKAYKNEIEFVLEYMVNDDYRFDENYRNRLSDYTKADLEYIIDDLVNDDVLNQELSETIEFYVNKHFGY